MATVRFGGFEWDEGKARRNVQKHASSFEEAMTAFADPLAVTAPDLYERGRLVTMGISVRARGQRRKYEEEG